jgi:hypothetical protein
VEGCTVQPYVKNRMEAKAGVDATDSYGDPAEAEGAAVK